MNPPLSPSLCDQAAQALASQDADWAAHIAAIGPCRLQAGPPQQPCEALIRAIAYQQLHARAGDAILARLLALYPERGFPSAGQLLDTDPQQLRACGFSAAKLAAILGIAQATQDGLVPERDAALAMADDALIARLITLKGVGRWTAEMFLIYSLGRSDVLPADDFGVREGYRRLKGLAQAAKPRQMREIGQAWQPYRTVATWYLWRVPAQTASP